MFITRSLLAIKYRLGLKAWLATISQANLGNL
jgi:hypothetical protein